MATVSDAPPGTTITLTREPEWWVAKDEKTGVVSHRPKRNSVNQESIQNKIRPGRLRTRKFSSSSVPTPMSYAPFSGMDVVKAMVNSDIYEWERTRGDHAILRWEPPEDHDSEARTVPVPLHDQISEGTLREIGEQAEMREFQEFKAWIDRNR